MWKLFARHVPMKEHVDALSQKAKQACINIYIVTPNRVRALAAAGAIDLSDKSFKTLVADCSPNSKGFTLFEMLETRDDAFNCLLHAS